MKCKPECKLLSELFSNLVKTGKSTDRDYWIMTEIYCLIHNGKDYCEQPAIDATQYDSSHIEMITLPHI